MPAENVSPFVGFVADAPTLVAIAFPSAGSNDIGSVPK
jgi:hypothetical protein